MEINKNNFIVIMSEKNVKSNLNDSKVAIQERKDTDGKPGKVEKLMDGKGNVNAIAEGFIRDGFDPKKIIINGEPSTDVLHLNNKKLKVIKRAPLIIGLYGYQKIGKFSDAQVAEMNGKKTLPNGLYMVFSPKITHYLNGMYNGTTPAQALVYKAKNGTLDKWNKRGVKYTNKIPKDYEFVNDAGKTYIKEKNTDIKEAKHDYKKRATIILSIAGGIIAAVTAIGIKLASRK